MGVAAAGVILVLEMDSATFSTLFSVVSGVGVVVVAGVVVAAGVSAALGAALG